MSNYPGFDLQTRIAEMIDPGAFDRRFDDVDPDAVVFAATQEKRRVDARTKAKQIIDLVRSEKATR